MISAARVSTDTMPVEEFVFLKDRPIHEKWQLIDGRPVAMVGSTTSRHLFVGRVYRSLYSCARSRGCAAFPDDLFVGGNDREFLAVPDVVLGQSK